MGTYAGTTDVTATRRPGTLKYGFGLNVEQELAKDVGAFARLGWNDGKTESFAFTANRPAGQRGPAGERRAMESATRYRGQRADRERAFRRTRSLPVARRPGFHDRRQRRA